MRFHEYPKALYQQGDASQAYAVASVPAEEEALREQGFRMIGEPAESEAPPPAPEPEPIPDTQAPEQPAEPEAAGTEPTIESVRAQLDALSIEYDRRWGLARLQSLLPTTTEG